MDKILSNTASNLIPSWALNIYDHVMSLDDPRTRHWPLVSTPTTPISYMFTYFFIVWLGPKVMQNKKPISLGPLLTIYNFFLVGFSAYMTYEFFMSAYLASYSVLCQSVDYSNTPLALRMANVSWMYYFSKYIEVLDTVFFILRKKNAQISFLHVFHHGTMIPNWWLCVRYIPGGPGWFKEEFDKLKLLFFSALLNSFVHVVMYTYYGLSSLGASMHPPLWCKKVVTRVQVIQFFVVLAHSLYVTTKCDFPIGFSLMATFYAISMIVLFANFYYQQYIRRARAKAKAKKSSNNSSRLYGNNSDPSNKAPRSSVRSRKLKCET